MFTVRQEEIIREFFELGYSSREIANEIGAWDKDVAQYIKQKREEDPVKWARAWFKCKGRKTQKKEKVKIEATYPPLQVTRPDPPGKIECRIMDAEEWAHSINNAKIESEHMTLMGYTKPPVKLAGSWNNGKTNSRNQNKEVVHR